MLDDHVHKTVLHPQTALVSCFGQRQFTISWLSPTAAMAITSKDGPTIFFLYTKMKQSNSITVTGQPIWSHKHLSGKLEVKDLQACLF